MRQVAARIQEHNDRLDESLALIQRVSQVTELARVERLASIKALAEAAQPDRLEGERRVKGEAVTGIVTAFCLASERERDVSERVPSGQASTSIARPARIVNSDIHLDPPRG